MSRAVFAALALLTAGAAHAHAMHFPSGGGSFVGGDLTAPIVLDATNTLCSQALSLSLEGDSDTGVQRAAANILAFCAGGANAMRVESTRVRVIGQGTEPACVINAAFGSSLEFFGTNVTAGIGISQGLASGNDELALCHTGTRISIGATSAEFAFSAGVKPDGDDIRYFGTWTNGSPGTGRRWILRASTLEALKAGTVGAPSISGTDANANTGIYFPADDQLGLSTDGVLALRVKAGEAQFQAGTNLTPGMAWIDDDDATGSGFARTGANVTALIANGTTVFEGAEGLFIISVTMRPDSTNARALGTSAQRWATFHTVSSNTSGFQSNEAANLSVGTTTAPTASFLRISSTGAVAWTPALAGESGTIVTACNVDAESDAVTMTDGSTYEGAGTVLGINDCVTFQRDSTTAKWRQTATSNN